MKHAPPCFCALRFLLLGWVLATPIYADTPPNIVFMLSDDQAWNGLSVPMHPDLDGSYNPRYDTPHTQRLAEQGMRFSAAYAPAPACAPTRISLMDGRSAAALRLTQARPSIPSPANPPPLPPPTPPPPSSHHTTPPPTPPEPRHPHPPLRQPAHPPRPPRITHNRRLHLTQLGQEVRFAP